MTEEQKKKLEQQLWNIANELRGKMDADEFRDYILGFIFYKYLSEKQYLYANTLLEGETVKDYGILTDEQDIEAIRDESLNKLGYFLRPQELFSAISKKGNADTSGESIPPIHRAPTATAKMDNFIVSSSKQCFQARAGLRFTE